MTRSTIVLAVLAIAGGCASTPAPEAGPPPAPLAALESCSGKLYLDVHNPLSMDIEVYDGDKFRSSEAKRIGRAKANGDTRLPVTRPVIRVFSLDVNGQGLTMEPTAATIRYQTVCIT